MTPQRSSPARAPSARPSQTRGSGFRPGAVLGRLLGSAARRPGLVLTGVVVVGGGTLFGWNALTQQPTRHPAPLFAGGKTEAARAEPARRAEVPLPTPRPDIQLASMQTGGIEPRPTPGADAIGNLIRSNGEPAAGRPAETAKAESPKADPKVASAQKALTKLGYGPLKADGILGATTRNALLRFEREKKLPETGAVAGRTGKQLATLSGMPLD